MNESIQPIVKVEGSPTAASLEFFVSQYITEFPQTEWDEKVWPMVVTYNSQFTESLSLDALKATYINAVTAEFNRYATETESLIRKEFATNKTTTTYRLAEYITRRFNIITIGEKEREMFVYRDGLYFRAENEVIYPEIQRILGELVTKNAKNETFHKIADMTSMNRDVFSSTPINLIPLKNGVYDMEKDILVPHSSHYRFTYQFPITYTKDADCPKTKAFMEQILLDDQRTVIEEWIGYYFYRLYLFKKAIIFVGEGDTGKTTLLETIHHLLGKDNVASVPLQKMTSDRFSAAHLYEKHGNLVDELSAKDISDTGNFKIATGGGSISGEYKFGNQFSFQNFAKFTFACNKIPDVTDFDDEAYFNRWIIISFKKPIEQRIPNFVETLKTDEERSGLFNVAMKSLRRLLDGRGFTYSRTAIETKLEMMRSGSSIAQFASEGVTNEAGAEVTKEVMYEAYTSFCTDRNLSMATKDQLGKKLPFYIPYASDGFIYDTSTANNGKRVRGWRNVVPVKSDETKKEEEDF